MPRKHTLSWPRPLAVQKREQIQTVSACMHTTSKLTPQQTTLQTYLPKQLRPVIQCLHSLYHSPNPMPLYPTRPARRPDREWLSDRAEIHSLIRVPKC